MTRKRGTWEPSGEELAEPKVKVRIAYDSDPSLIGTVVELPASVAKVRVNDGWAAYADDKRSDKVNPETALTTAKGERLHEDSGWGKGTPGAKAE